MNGHIVTWCRWIPRHIQRYYALGELLFSILSELNKVPIYIEPCLACRRETLKWDCESQRKLSKWRSLYRHPAVPSWRWHHWYFLTIKSEYLCGPTHQKNPLVAWPWRATRTWGSFVKISKLTTTFMQSCLFIGASHFLLRNVLRPPLHVCKQYRAALVMQRKIERKGIELVLIFGLHQRNNEWRKPYINEDLMSSHYEKDLTFTLYVKTWI